VETSDGSFPAFRVAAGEDDMRPLACELQCGVITDAAVRAGNEDPLAGERGDVGRLPLLTHIRIGRAAACRKTLIIMNCACWVVGL